MIGTLVPAQYNNLTDWRELLGFLHGDVAVLGQMDAPKTDHSFRKAAFRSGRDSSIRERLAR